jgi:DMSO/TMAO reductase YedYZ molybdopterin-dependent catalytic subunit
VVRNQTPMPAHLAAVAGAAGVAVALGVGELLAGTTTLVPSAVDAVGQQLIPLAPEPLTRWAIATFGTANTTVLGVGTVLVALVVGAVTGAFARRRTGPVWLVFAAFGGLGATAALARSESSLPATLAVLATGVVAGAVTYDRLLARLVRPPAPTSTEGAVARRGILVAAGGTVAAAALAAAVGRSVLRGNLAVVDPGAVTLPAPTRAIGPVPSAASLAVDGLSPLVTPNDRFFVIDTAIAVPQVDPATWSLRIHGAVDRELILTYDELLALPLEEVDVTLSCVSNEVGGSLVGNARWLGVRLEELLDRVGVRPEGEQVLARSTDGFTAGFPTAVARDGRDAIVAVGMNGEPLPTRHGFPARLVVPGLYGYVSATKWLAEIELTGWEVDGYWVPRGWAKEGPVKTQSRIDVPASGARVEAGDVVVAGVAWAPLRGIARVEVRVDDGGWVVAELGDPLAAGTWVQWRAEVAAGPGGHVVEVRATDGDDRTQPGEPRPPAPDGAEGWHRVSFQAV